MTILDGRENEQIHKRASVQYERESWLPTHLWCLLSLPTYKIVMIMLVCKKSESIFLLYPMQSLEYWDLIVLYAKSINIFWSQTMNIFFMSSTIFCSFNFHILLSFFAFFFNYGWMVWNNLFSVCARWFLKPV